MRYMQWIDGRRELIVSVEKEKTENFQNDRLTNKPLIDTRKDRQTDGWMDGRTDRQTELLYDREGLMAIKYRRQIVKTSIEIY